MEFGRLKNLVRGLRDGLVDTTRGMSTGAAGISRKGAGFARDSAHLPAADRDGAEVVSKLDSATTEPGRGRVSDRSDHREPPPSPVATQITERDVEVMRRITAGTGFFERINRGLRRGTLDRADREFVEQLRTAVAKLRTYSGKVYRGAQLYPDDLARYQKGNIVTEPAFTSTSRLKSRAFGGNTRFTIRSSTGKRLERYSSKPHEKEVIFPPGTRFEVVDVRYNKHWCRTEIEMVDRGIPG
ncbi:ADP-ribosyltransferase domain-containing protein [Nocardia sp. NPDC001965]